MSKASRFIYLTDIHVTDSKLDDYRWKFWPWLKAQVKEFQPDALFILGDLTEKKDKHSSQLVNKLIQELVEISRCVNFDHERMAQEVYILQGNHDFIDADHAFFQFINQMPNFTFVKTPRIIEHYKHLLLPHTKTPEKDWEEFRFDINRWNGWTICMHQSMEGAKTSSGYVLEEKALPADFFKWVEARILSGDIHVPQSVHDVRYIGAPYPIYFGDTYQGYITKVDESGKIVPVPYNTLSRWSLYINAPKELEKIDFSPGDQAKITMNLAPTEYYLYDQYRKQILEIIHQADVELVSLEMKPVRPRPKRISLEDVGNNIKDGEKPEDTFKRFADREKLTYEYIVEGMAIIKAQRKEV